MDYTFNGWYMYISTVPVCQNCQYLIKLLFSLLQSVGHALFSSVVTVYTMLAVAYLEEKTTPRYIPRLCPVKKKRLD